MSLDEALQRRVRAAKEFTAALANQRRVMEMPPPEGPGRRAADLLIRYVRNIPESLIVTDEEKAAGHEARRLASAYSQGLVKPQWARPHADDYRQAYAAARRVRQLLARPAEDAVGEAWPAYETILMESAMLYEEETGLPVDSFSLSAAARRLDTQVSIHMLQQRRR